MLKSTKDYIDNRCYGLATQLDNTNTRHYQLANKVDTILADKRREHEMKLFTAAIPTPEQFEIKLLQEQVRDLKNTVSLLLDRLGLEIVPERQEVKISKKELKKKE